MLSHEGVSEGRRGTRASTQGMRAGKAGWPGVGLDGRWLTRGRMSGLRGQMSGLAQMDVLLSGWATPDVRSEGPDVRGFKRRRMSGTIAECPG